MIKRFGISLAYLLSLHVAALIIFFVCRLTLFLTIDYEFTPEVASDFLLQSEAFVRGVWFDNVIACYILIVPLIAVLVSTIAGYAGRWLFRGTGIFMGTFYTLAFIISAANIPYFCYFFKNINSSIFQWFEHGTTTAGMVFGESSYYLPIALGICSIVMFWWLTMLLARIFQKKSIAISSKFNTRNFIATLAIGAACIGLCIFGIRGRTGYNPIKVSQAYYCEDPFLNQLGVSPTFNLLTSTLDDQRKENRKLQLMSEDEAVANVQKFLNRNGIEGISPIAREVTAQSEPIRKNIVIVLMESMSARFMQNFGHNKALTPYLDELYSKSCVFTNCYSAGIHTNHGIYASLYSFPAIMKRNAMKGTNIPIYSGLPTVLKDNGYRNLFFMTHESQYDNMNAFFRTNGFDEIYAEENYPSDKIANSFGVQDDFLFSYALPVLNERAKADEPFFSVLLTISNHPPYIIPEHFAPKSSKPEEQIVEYADWSIAQFMKEVEKQPWFDNTIFVFMGDHGKLVGNPDCEMPQSYNHVPLMLYGKDIEHQIIDKPCGQIDLAPTLLGLLNISYTQNNYGIDLFKEERPCIFFTADDLIAARNHSALYIYSPEQQTDFCYNIAPPYNTLRPTQFNEEMQNLKTYCFSMLQSAEHIVGKQETVDYKR